MYIFRSVVTVSTLLIFLFSFVCSTGIGNSNIDKCVISSDTPTYKEIITTTNIEDNGMEIVFDYPIYEKRVEAAQKGRNDKEEVIIYDVEISSSLNTTEFDFCKARSKLSLPSIHSIQKINRGDENFIINYKPIINSGRGGESDENKEDEEEEEQEQHEVISFPLQFSYQIHQHYQCYPFNTKQDLALYRVVDSYVEFKSKEKIYRWFLEIQHYGELTIGFSGFKSGQPSNHTINKRAYDKYDNHISMIEISSIYDINEEFVNEILMFEYNKEESSRIVQEVSLRPVSTGYSTISPVPATETDERKSIMNVNQFISSSSENMTFPSYTISAQTEIVLTTIVEQTFPTLEEVIPQSITFTCLSCKSSREYLFEKECGEKEREEKEEKEEKGKNKKSYECFEITETSKKRSEINFRIKSKHLEIGTYTIKGRFALSLSSPSGLSPLPVFVETFSQVVISKFEPKPTFFKIVITFAGAALGFITAGGGLAIGLFVMRVIRKQSDKNRVYHQHVGGKHVIDETTGERIQLLDMRFDLRHREIKFKESEVRSLNRSFDEVFKLQKASKYTPYVHCKHCWEEQHGKSLPQLQHQQQMKKIQQKRNMMIVQYQQQQQRQRQLQMIQQQQQQQNHFQQQQQPPPHPTQQLILPPPLPTRDDEDDEDEDDDDDDEEDNYFLKYDGKSESCMKCGLPLLRFIGFEIEDLFCVLCSMMNKYQPRPHGRCLLHLSNSKKSNHHRRQRKKKKLQQQQKKKQKQKAQAQSQQKKGYHPLPISGNKKSNNNNGVSENRRVERPPDPVLEEVVEEEEDEEEVMEYQKQGAVYVIYRGQFSVGSVSRQMKKRKKEQQKQLLLLQQQKKKNRMIKSPSLNMLSNTTTTTTGGTTGRRRRRRRKTKKKSEEDKKIPEWIEKVTSSSIWKLNSLMRFEYLSLMSFLVHKDLSGPSFSSQQQQQSSSSNNNNNNNNLPGYILNEKVHNDEIKRMEHAITLLQQTLKHSLEKISEVGPNMKSRYLKRLKIDNLKLGNDHSNIRNRDLELFFDNFRLTLTLFAAQIQNHIGYLTKSVTNLQARRKQHLEQLKRYKNNSKKSKFNQQHMSSNNSSSMVLLSSGEKGRRKRKRKRKRSVEEFRFVDEIDEVDEVELNSFSPVSSAPSSPNNNENDKISELKKEGSLIDKSQQKQQIQKRSKKRKRNDGEILRIGKHHYHFSVPTDIPQKQQQQRQQQRQQQIRKRNRDHQLPPPPPLPSKNQQYEEDIDEEEEEEEDVIFDDDDYHQMKMNQVHHQQQVEFLMNPQLDGDILTTEDTIIQIRGPSSSIVTPETIEQQQLSQKYPGDPLLWLPPPTLMNLQQQQQQQQSESVYFNNNHVSVPMQYGGHKRTKEIIRNVDGRISSNNSTGFEELSDIGSENSHNSPFLNHHPPRHIKQELQQQQQQEEDEEEIEEIEIGINDSNKKSINESFEGDSHNMMIFGDEFQVDGDHHHHQFFNNDNTQEIVVNDDDIEGENFDVVQYITNSLGNVQYGEEDFEAIENLNNFPFNQSASHNNNDDDDDDDDDVFGIEDRLL